MKKFLSFLGLVLILISCSKEDPLPPCINGDFIQTFHIETSFGCQDTRTTMKVTGLEGNSFKIFSNQRDALNQVSTIGNCGIDRIDFNRSDLLVGQTWVESYNFKINYVYIEKCNGQKGMTVELYQNRGGKGHFITYHAIIPKLRNGEIPSVTTRIITP
ncbi:MAG: hypothetical protein LBE34_06100 [Flavobacteriaceae bacterium]|jgi:hypothetical protein|nr:hypothetical protein [Flavobacteriaceae bacterium]